MTTKTALLIDLKMLLPLKLISFETFLGVSVQTISVYSIECARLIK